MKKSITVLVAGFLLVGLGSVYLLRPSSDKLEAAIPRSAQSQPLAIPDSLPPTLPEPSTEMAPPATTVPPSPAESQHASAPTNPQAPAHTQRLSNPEGRDVTRTMWRMSLPGTFPGVGEALEMSSQELDNFFDLLARQQSDLGEDTAGLLTGQARDPAARLEWHRRIVEQQRANDAQLREALGSRYDKWQEYQSALSVRQQVSELNAILQPENQIPAAQLDPLITALTNQHFRLSQDLRQWNTSEAAINSPRLLDEHMRRTVDNHRELLRTASGYLTTDQQEAYWKVLDRTAMREVSLTRLLGKLGTVPVQTVP